MTADEPPARMRHFRMMGDRPKQGPGSNMLFYLPAARPEPCSLVGAASLDRVRFRGWGLSCAPPGGQRRAVPAGFVQADSIYRPHGRNRAVARVVDSWTGPVSGAGVCLVPRPEASGGRGQQDLFRLVLSAGRPAGTVHLHVLWILEPGPFPGLRSALCPARRPAEGGANRAPWGLSRRGKVHPGRVATRTATHDRPVFVAEELCDKHGARMLAL